MDDSQSVTLSRLAYEMAEWEVHALRQVITVVKSQLQLHRRQCIEPACLEMADLCLLSIEHFNDNQQRALTDPQYRRASTQQLGTEVPTDAE